MKKQILIVIGVLFFILGIVGIWKVNRDYYPLWNSNTIKVTVNKPLSAEKVKIEFGNGVNTINRYSDEELFKNREKYSVLFDGSLKEKMSNGYGENDFLITYDNSYYFSFRQFKLNWKHQHDYHFHFSKKKSKIFVRVDIEGQDAMNFKRQMTPIKMANKYRCNVPIDSNKVIYNMIELIESK